MFSTKFRRARSCLQLALAISIGLASSGKTEDQVSTTKQTPSGYATIHDTMPFYISETAPNTYKISAGSRFVVICETGVSSSSAQIGDSVSAKIAEQVSYAGHIVIPKSTMLQGSICLVDRARHSLRADLPGKHWLNAQGALGLQFKQIEISNKPISIDAVPAVDSLVDSVGAVRFPIVTDKKGDITVSYGTAKYSGLALAIEGGSLAAGPFGLLLGPAMSGIAGAASPSYAVGHPDAETGLKERGKGFLLGLSKGLPGVGLITDAVEHGSDLNIAPGDKFIVELKVDLEIVK